MLTSLKSLAVAFAVTAIALASMNSADAGNAGLRLWQKQHPGSTPPSWKFGSTRLAPSGVYRTTSNAPASVETVRSFSYEPGSTTTTQGESSTTTTTQGSQATGTRRRCCCPCRCR